MTNSRSQPTYPPGGLLKPWNPIDHARLLWWFFAEPGELRAYRKRVGKGGVQDVGAWVSSTLIWLPILVLMLAISLGTLPVEGDFVPLWLMAAGLIAGWGITGLLGVRTREIETEWRMSLGDVFPAAFIIVFGVAFGVAFGTAFVTGLDVAGVIAFGSTFGARNIVIMVLLFGITFGIAFIVADSIAFGGIFVVAPVIGLVAGLIGVLGISFVGVFFSMFIVVFGMAFVIAFVIAFAFASLIADKIERQHNSKLERVLRLAGLIALLAAHSALIWLILLDGWRSFT